MDFFPIENLIRKLCATNDEKIFKFDRNIEQAHPFMLILFQAHPYTYTDTDTLTYTYIHTSKE